MSKVLGNERISQILPTVKCSDCGKDVQLRQLDKYAKPLINNNNNNKPPTLPISPRSPDGFYSSPNNNSYTNHQNNNYDNDYYYASNKSTPPYSSNSSSSSSSPHVKFDTTNHFHSSSNNTSTPYNNYHDDYHSPPPSSKPSYNHHYQQQHYNEDYYHLPNTPTYNHQYSSPTSNDYYPRKNSTSPAPPDSISPKSPTYLPTDKSIYPRNDSLHNLHSPKSPTNGSGALDTLMEDLMNSMNEVNNYQNGSQDHCYSCGEEFDYRDDVKNTGNKCYHKSCFNCRLCRTPLAVNRHFEFDNQLYCERDFAVVKNRVNCAACDRPITSNITPIKALGRNYHPGHLKCYHCYCPITEKTGFKERQQRIYCRKDYKELFLPKCRACNLPVEKEAVSAVDGKLKGKWHLDCFGCHTCHQPFPDNTFYVFENLPYCRRHYHQLNNSLCRTCDEPIEGPCAQTTEGWRFHPNCFKCHSCHIPITDVYYMYDRKIYCETHVHQLQQQRNFRAEKRRTQFGRI
ncbi:unnamed protein product [Cunninghamella blakesleeana]